MKTWWLGGRGHSPMQHLWQPFVSGILVVKANLLRRENSQAVVTAVLKEPMTSRIREVSQSFSFFFLPLQESVVMLDSDNKKTAQHECSNIRKVVTLSQNETKKTARLVGPTWVRFCLGSGESGTEQPGRVSLAGRTARWDCGSTAGRFSLQQNTEYVMISFVSKTVSGVEVIKARS